MDKLECGTRIVVSNAWKNEHPTSTIWETGAPDANLENVLEGFYGCLIGLTWHPDAILRAMKNFVEERLTDDTEEN